jgi:mRNA interferase MazF
MNKPFDQWNELKKNLQRQNQQIFFFHEREIWWCSLGINLGSEQDGRNDTFERPVLIVKKFNQDIFLGLPLTTAIKEGKYYYETTHEDRHYSVVLSQMRLLDKKRLQRKIRVLPEGEFEEIVRRFKGII